MTDAIKSEIAKTSERKKVFTLLQKLTGKLTQVEFRSGQANGEFWVEKGSKIFLAKAEGDGDNGMMAMMQLLAAHNITFRVMPTPVEKPKSNVDIKLADLVGDENAVIQKIKDVLWPVAHSESDVNTEASLPPIPAEVLQQTYDRAAKRNSEQHEELKKLEESFIETETSIPPLPAEQPPIDLPPLVSEEPLIEIADEPIEAAMAPAPDPNDDRPQHTTDKDKQAEEAELNILEQMVLAAAAQQEAAAEAKAGAEETTTSISSRSEQADASPAEDDDLTRKRRNEMRILEMWSSEDPENFFTHDEAVSEDDLLKQRRAEMAALNAMLEAHASLSKEIFQERDIDKPDELRDRRRREFEVLKEYFQENPERFNEYVGLGEDDPNGVEELRAQILKVMEDTRDVEAFEAKDGRMSDESVLRPVWKPEEEKEPEPEPEPPKPAEDEYIPPDLEPSPFGDHTSKLNFEEKHKGKLDVPVSTDDMSLIEREPDRQNKFGVIDRSKLKRGEMIPRHLLIAAAVFAAFGPLVALYIYHNMNMNAEADYEDQRAASQLAARAAQEESMSSKPQEAFRMPAGSSNQAGQPGPSSAASGSGSYGAGVTQQELNSYKYRPPTHAVAQPTPAQLAKAQRAIASGEQYLASGDTEQAVRVLSDGLLDCPHHAVLRIRAARAYMLMRNYGAAKDILLSGMSEAQSQAEFDSYLAVMREMPLVQQ